MPIGLWALHRYHVTGRRLALVGSTGAFVMQGLSNGYYLFFFALPVVVVGLYAVCRPRHPRRRMVLDLGLGALAVLIVFAPIALVYYGLQRSQGLVRGVSEVTHYGADLASYAHVYPSSFLWSRWLSEGAPERELFAGLVVMVLAAAALVGSVRRRPRRHVPPDEPAAPSISTPTLTWLYGAIALLAVPVFRWVRSPPPGGHRSCPSGRIGWPCHWCPGWTGCACRRGSPWWVYLALSVLAGIGVAHYFAGLSTRVRAGLGASLATLVLLEGYGPTPYETLPRDGRSFDAAVYTWLADRPSGAVLELPMEGRHENLQAHHTLRYQYRTLEHGHPLVNGFSGYSSLLVDFLPVAPMWDRAVTGDLLRGLRLIGVRYVIVHEQLYVDQSLARATVAALRAQRDEVATVHTVGTTHVFDLGEVSWPRQASPPLHRRRRRRVAGWPVSGVGPVVSRRRFPRAGLAAAGLRRRYGDPLVDRHPATGYGVDHPGVRSASLDRSRSPGADRSELGRLSPSPADRIVHGWRDVRSRGLRGTRPAGSDSLAPARHQGGADRA